MTWRVPAAIVSLLFACVAAGTHAQQPPAAEEINSGRSLALKLCTPCHVVSPDQPYPPILQRPGPSFSAIANRPTTTGDSLRRFMRTTHTTISRPYDMPSLELTDHQMEQIIGYIMSLRRKR